MISNIFVDSPNILIISPHPDDEVIGCGALISQASKKGCNVHVEYITTGITRQLVTGSTSSIEREREIKAVSEYAGFTYGIMFKDAYFCLLDTLPQKELIDNIEDLVAKIKPRIVCIPFSDSYNQDHRAVYHACITSFRPVPQHVRHMPSMILEYEEPYSWTTGNNFTPNFYLDASNSIREKCHMMSLHSSQDRPEPFPRATSLLEARLKIRGSEIGTSAAEAYRILRAVSL